MSKQILNNSEPQHAYIGRLADLTLVPFRRLSCLPIRPTTFSRLLDVSPTIVCALVRLERSFWRAGDLLDERIGRSICWSWRGGTLRGRWGYAESIEPLQTCSILTASLDVHITHSLLFPFCRWTTERAQADEAGYTPVILVPHEWLALPELRWLASASGEVVAWLCPPDNLGDRVHAYGEECRVREGDTGGMGDRRRPCVADEYIDELRGRSIRLDGGE